MDHNNKVNVILGIVVTGLASITVYVWYLVFKLAGEI